MIDKGRSLETSGRWAEALSHYEEALREHPEDVNLTGRFDTARLHYSLEQRYDDRSFRDSITTLNSREALDLYGDLLAKIGTHYYTTPPWQDLFQPRRPEPRHRAGRPEVPLDQRRPCERQPDRTAPHQPAAARRRATKSPRGPTR